MAKLSYNDAINRLAYANCGQLDDATFRLDLIGSIQDTVDKFNLPKVGCMVLQVLVNLRRYVIYHFNTRMDQRMIDLERYGYSIEAVNFVKSNISNIIDLLIQELVK
mgnify:FL=1|jgi:hypothetical protein